MLKKAKRIGSVSFFLACAMIGAVFAGIGLGWIDNPPFDLRAAGAVAGAGLAMAAKALHFV